MDHGETITLVVRNRDDLQLDAAIIDTDPGERTIFIQHSLAGIQNRGPDVRNTDLVFARRARDSDLRLPSM